MGDLKSTPPPASESDPCKNEKQKPATTRISQPFQFIYRFLPSFPPACKHPSFPPPCKPPSFPKIHHSPDPAGGHHRPPPSAPKISGTIYGYRQNKVSLSLQENTKTLPMLVLEIPMQTVDFQKELMSGPVKLALECEKRPDKRMLFEEPTWTLFCNGKKIGDGVKRQANHEDLHVMEVLKAVSTGAGALQGVKEADGDIQYMRSQFGRVVGSKDSETLYMVNPDSKSGPELTILLVRM